MELRNLSNLFACIFRLYRVFYLMFAIEIIEYMDCGTKEFIHSICIHFLTVKSTLFDVCNRDDRVYGLWN